MASRMTLSINGQDFSEAFNRYGYKIQYETRDGGNGGTMLDGTYITDMLARKAKITLSSNVGADTEALLAALQDEYVTVAYTAPTGGDVTGMFSVEIGTFSAAMYRDGQIIWDNGATVTLTEV